MIKTSELIGKPVMSVKEGRQWGRVSGLYIDLDGYKVSGVVLGNLEKCLPFGKITTFGEESVMFPGGDDLMECGARPKGLLEFSKLKSIRVITEGGAELGRIQDLSFSRETGAITHYEIGDSIAGDRKIMSQEGVVLIGPDAMIIRNEAAEVADAMRVKNPIKGLMGKLFKNAKDKAGEAATKAKEYSETAGRQMIEIKKKAQDGAQAAAEKSKVAAEKVRERSKIVVVKAKSAGDIAGKKAAEAAEVIKKKSAEIAGRARDAAEKIKEKVKKKTGN